MKFNSQTARAAGQKGGQKTYEKHGRQHMQIIGRKGFHATVKKVYGGDYRKAINALINRGLIAQDPNPENCAWTTMRMVDWLPTNYTPPEEDRLD